MCPCWLKANVVSIPLYGAEVRTVYRRWVKQLHAFMTRHLRSIMRITWMAMWQRRKYPNEEGCHLWKIFSSKRIPGRLDTSWVSHQTGYQSNGGCLCHIATDKMMAMMADIIEALWLRVERPTLDSNNMHSNYVLPCKTLEKVFHSSLLLFTDLH